MGFLWLPRARVTLPCGERAYSAGLSLQSTGAACGGFISCGMQARGCDSGSREQTPQLWCMGLAKPRCVESSRTRDGTHALTLVDGFSTTGSPGKSYFIFKIYYPAVWEIKCCSGYCLDANTLSFVFLILWSKNHCIYLYGKWNLSLNTNTLILLWADYLNTMQLDYSAF